MRSETTGELAKALAKAQAVIEGASKDSTNPHFGSKYADLASVWAACRKALTDQGLAVTQTTAQRDEHIILITRLLHVSGEWVESELPLIFAKNDMQGLGSALTYARRYSLAAMAGVSPEDDDGNAAVASTTKAQTSQAPVSDGPLRVVKVESKPTSTGKDRWRVTLSDGRVATTFKDKLHALALALKDEGCEVVADVKEGTYGLDLNGLQRVKAPVEAPNREAVPVIDSASIPF